MLTEIEGLLTLPQVCRLLNVGRGVVRGAIDRGELPASKVGSRLRVSREDLKHFLERNRAGKKEHN